MNKFKSYLILLIILLFSNKINAQNIVYNGSFEIRDSVFQNSSLDYRSCPYITNDIYNPQLKMSKGWADPNGDFTVFVNNQQYDLNSSSDYYHSCCNNDSNLPDWVTGCSVGIPKNYWNVGYQYPRTGKGYVGSVCYYFNDENPVSEFIQ